MLTFTRPFNQRGDFEALRSAESFLTDRGFSVGRGQRGEPAGILYGKFEIQKWRNLRATDRAALHGVLVGDRRNGPVFIEIHASCPPGGLAALREEVMA